jgi:hypothetical protein
VSSILQKFALGPGFWKRVSAAEAKAPLDQSAWERGLATMARQYESPRTLVWPIQTVLAAAVGVPVGNAVAVNSWIVQALVGGATALLVFWLFPVVGAAILAARPAPIRQRNEARNYARDLEAHAREYAEWATRREMADDFKFNTLEEARNMDQWNLPPADIEERWRANATAFRNQIADRGAGPEVTGEIDRQLEVLERREDPYGDNVIGRVRGSMMATCQNVWGHVRAEQAPTPPAPPEPPPKPEAVGRAFQ